MQYQRLVEKIVDSDESLSKLEFFSVLIDYGFIHFTVSATWNSIDNTSRTNI